jgi:glycosyltransferase involved in cell wall biosynthesis
MPKLSIITINFNNAEGLKKTMESVLAQTTDNFEYIVVDGGSTDTSCQVINDKCLITGDDLIIKGEAIVNGIQVRWVSEKDNGIYHAMNKGIRMAKGEYCQFLNYGDYLVRSNVTENILKVLDECDILYGNMMKVLPKRIVRDRGFAGRIPTMLDFYTGTLNHSPAYIKRNLFEKYGLYDESFKIVSDWKWYLQVIILNGIVPVYKNIDITNFDMDGISNLNSVLDKTERIQVLSDILPATIMKDYENWSFSIEQVKRLNRFWLTRNGFWLVERILFKWEKWLMKKEIEDE